MKIYVRRRHIRNGHPEDGGACPIALAIIEQLGVGDLSVGDEEIRLGETNFHCPTRVTRFVHRFDSGKPVKPFAFTIRA